MKVYLDTSVIGAATVKAHVHHQESAAALRLIHKKQLNAATSTHALAEAYAVLTRAPFQPRLYPSDVWNSFSANLIPHLEVAALSMDLYCDAIKLCAAHGWIGGRVYDAVHLRCSSQVGCDRIYTFNVRHFVQLAPELADRIGPPAQFF